MRATVEVDVKNLDDVTKKLVKDLQKKNRSLEAKLKSRDSKIYELESDLRDLQDDKEVLGRIKSCVMNFAEEFGFHIETEDERYQRHYGERSKY